jgi:hypothetical protein
MITKTLISNVFSMNKRQLSVYSKLTYQEKETFDYLVHVKNRKVDDVLFFLHSTFSRDDFKKPSFADLSTKQVVNTCYELQLKDVA